VNDLTLSTQQYTDRTVITVAGEIGLHRCSALAEPLVQLARRVGK